MRRARLNKMVSAILDNQTLEKVKTITDTKMISISEWIRALVERAVQRESKGAVNRRQEK